MKKLFTFLAIVVVLVGFFYFPVGANSWHLVTSSSYIVPEESSVFTFHVTKMNEGSGEWWLYGEDSRYFYHFTGAPGESYLKAEKSRIAHCSGFRPDKIETWCPNLL